MMAIEFTPKNPLEQALHERDREERRQDSFHDSHAFPFFRAEKARIIRIY